MTTPTVADLVAVKPLEWRVRAPDYWRAVTSIGGYTVAPEFDGFGVWLAGSDDDDDYPAHVFDTPFEAKAAAQADFERRIFAHLSPADLHDATAKQRDELAAVIRNALDFANRAAGEGIEIDGLSPEDFLMEYSDATGDEDWDCFPDRIAAVVSAALSPAATEPVAIPRYPTQEMMDAGLYHLSEDVTHDDLFTAWTAMFDAVALDGGTSDSLPPSPVTVEEAIKRGATMVTRAPDGSYRVGNNGYNRFEDALEDAALRALAGEKS